MQNVEQTVSSTVEARELHMSALHEKFVRLAKGHSVWSLDP